MNNNTNNIVFLGLGTNLGDRDKNLNEVISNITSFSTILERSKIYETDPWGYDDQPPFLNMVIKISCQLTPHQLLKKIKHIETNMGREPTFRYGPRLIDIDILFFNDLIMTDEILVIPHPNLHKRAFVLRPLLDISPDYIHPKLGKTIQKLAQDIETNDIKEYIEQGQGGKNE